MSSWITFASHENKHHQVCIDQQLGQLHRVKPCLKADLDYPSCAPPCFPNCHARRLQIQEPFKVATDNLEVVAFGVGQPIMDGPIFEGVQTYEQPHP
jgi:hypothetical protein